MTRLCITVLTVPAMFFLPVLLTHGKPPRRPALKMETVPIRGARFVMGTPLKKGEPRYHEDEAQHTVTVKAFRIGKYPVTARQMCLFLNSKEAKKYDRSRLYNHRDMGEYTYSTIALDDGRYVPREDAADAPANQVTWMGAVLFCRWLSVKTGKTFRLPTEAEWELAARGPKGRKWPWGDDAPTVKHGMRYDNNGPIHLTWPRVSVGSHPANATPEGVQDMLAYVSGEWCATKYVAHPSAKQLTDPAMDLEDLRTRRVVRGYYDRYYQRGGWLLRLTEYGWRSHLGCPWTRVGCDPVKAARRAARHGFRVVEEVKSDR
jgi:formylglycine-generating enzyme required for sulfatase activity